MTKVYKEIKVTRTEKEVVRTICDWCGQEIKTRAKECSGNSYPETSISHTINYPCYEDSGGVGWAINDLCKECGIELKKELIKLGIAVVEIEW
jgi:hypothetical protein